MAFEHATPVAHTFRPGLKHFVIMGAIAALTACGGSDGDPVVAGGGATPAPTTPTTPGATPTPVGPVGSGTPTAAGDAIAIDPANPNVFTTDDLRPSDFTTLVEEASDEFNGNALDLTKWCTRMTWGGSEVPIGYPDAECTKWPSLGVGDFAQEAENQRFREFNALGEPLHVVSDGSLKLRATKTSPREFQPYESSAIRSKYTFKPTGTERYFITARVFLPEIRGTLPTVWLNPGLDPSEDSGPGGIPYAIPEIDLFEAALNNVAIARTGDLEDEFSMRMGTQMNDRGGQPGGAQTDTGFPTFTYTHPTYNRTWEHWQGTSFGVNLRGRWVRMGTEWTATEVCFYLEGMRTNCQAYRWVLDDGTPANPATLIAYFAIGNPEWAGRNGVDDSQFPTAFEIDYLRVYRAAR